MRGRIYDPRLGRFMQADPIVIPTSQGLNRYTYVKNNPLNSIDPSGFEDLSDLAAGSADEDPYNVNGSVGNGSSENNQAGTDIHAETASEGAISHVVVQQWEGSVALQVGSTGACQLKDGNNQSWYENIPGVSWLIAKLRSDDDSTSSVPKKLDAD